MAPRRVTRIQQYVDAVRDLRAMRRQREADPTRAVDPVWAAMYREAETLVATLYRALTGGDLGKARRQLDQEENTV